MPEPTHPKPLPVITEENRPFWEGCRQGKLLLQQCPSCAHYQFYPRLYCMHCGSRELHWQEVSGRATLYSYTIIYQNKAPEFVHDTPYNVAIVQLEEGPRLMANIVETLPEQLYVDMPLSVVFEPMSEAIALPRFKPATR